MRRSHRFLKNLSVGFVARGWKIVLALLTTPYIVNTLGADAYGLLAILLIFVGYFNLADFGMGNTVVKYLSEYLAREDRELSRRMLGTALRYYAAVGLAGSFLMVLATPLIVSHVVKIPAAMKGEATMAFYIASITFAMHLVVAFLVAILKGYQRFDVLAARDIGLFTVSTLLTVLLLHLGYGLTAVVLLNLLTTVASAFVFLVVVRRLLGPGGITNVWDQQVFAVLFHFSKWKFVGGWSSRLAYTFDKVVISALLGVAQVTYYVVPLNLAQYVGMRLVGTISQVLFPLMSESAVIDNPERQKELYFRSMKWVYILLAPAVVFLLAYGDKFLLFWIGEEFSRKGTKILWILTFSYFVTALAHNDVLCFESRGNAIVPNVTAFASAVIIISLNIILLPVLGIVGAAVAFAVGAIVTSIYLKHRALSEMLGSGWEELGRRILVRLVAATLSSLLLLIPFRNMAVGIASCLVLVVATGIVVFAAFFCFRCVDSQDKEILISFLNRFGVGRAWLGYAEKMRL